MSTIKLLVSNEVRSVGKDGLAVIKGEAVSEIRKIEDVLQLASGSFRRIREEIEDIEKTMKSLGVSLASIGEGNMSLKNAKVIEQCEVGEEKVTRLQKLIEQHRKSGVDMLVEKVNSKVIAEMLVSSNEEDTKKDIEEAKDRVIASVRQGDSIVALIVGKY